MVSAGMGSQVTTFTASDFGRTLTSNSNGTDHGWGSHHLVVGGAVQGGDMTATSCYWRQSGQRCGAGRLIPTTAVDQYAGTLARWFGLSDGQVARSSRISATLVPAPTWVLWITPRTAFCLFPSSMKQSPVSFKSRPQGVVHGAEQTFGSQAIHAQRKPRARRRLTRPAFSAPQAGPRRSPSPTTPSKSSPRLSTLPRASPSRPQPITARYRDPSWSKRASPSPSRSPMRVRIPTSSTGTASPSIRSTTAPWKKARP